MGQQRKFAESEGVFAGGPHDQERRRGAQGVGGGAMSGVVNFGRADQGDGVGVGDVDLAALMLEGGGDSGAEGAVAEDEHATPDDLGGGQQRTQPAQARIGDLGVGQAGLELGTGQVEDGYGEVSGRGDSFEAGNGEFYGGVDAAGASWLP